MPQPAPETGPAGRGPDRRHLLLRGIGAWALAAPLLGGCGFQPLYGAAGDSGAAHGRVSIETSEGPAGFALRERLLMQLGPGDRASHRLVVDLAITRDSGIITRDAEITRYSLTGIARFSLVPMGADRPILQGAERAVTGFSAPAIRTATAFATLAAERDAEARLARTLADQIALRLAVSAPDWAPA